MNTLHNMKIKTKLIGIVLILVILSLAISGYLNYKSTEAGINQQIATNVENEVKAWKDKLESSYKQIKHETKLAKETAKDIVTAQAKVIQQLASANISTNELKNKIAQLTVGKTGYVWIIDYNYKYVVSQNRKRDGESLKNVKVITDMVNLAKPLSFNTLSFYEYPWKNPDDETARDKITCMINLKKYGWVIGISSYYDDIVDFSFQKDILSKYHKEFSNVVVGKTGYMFILDTKGTLVKHPTIEGKNIIHEDYIKQMVSKKNGVINYQYEGKAKIAAIAFYPEKNWILTSSAYLNEFHDILNKIKNEMVTTIIVSIVVILFLLYMLINSQIIKPINKVKEALNAFGMLDFTIKTDIEDLERKDEIGEISRAYDTSQTEIKKMVEYLLQSSSNLNESSNSLSAISSQMAAAVEEMSSQATTVSSASEEMSANVTSISAATEQASTNMKSVAAATDEMNSNINTVAAASEQASVNVSNVVKKVTVVANKIKSIANNIETMNSGVNTSASAIEEMTASISEISTNTQKASDVSMQANTMANEVQTEMDGLQKVADGIGKIIKVVADIADQTNMLALNATIEAASAGDAGKGFAVVANEVKELAKQTAEATQKITQQIEQMQTASKNSYGSITKIANIVKSINDINTTIASAVEEQSITTTEIANTIAAVAKESQQVTNAAEEIDKATSTVNINATEAAEGVNEIARSTQETAVAASEVAKNIAETNEGVNEISRNTSQITEGVAEVTTNITSIAQVSEEVAESATGVDSSAKDLSEMANKLATIVKKFKI